MVVLVVVQREDKEEVFGMGQYFIDENTHNAEVAFVVRDDYQNQGIGAELLSYLTYLAKRKGLHGFTATVLMDNKPMLMLFEKAGFMIDQMPESGAYELKLSFR
jgi:RimJ/RimL family protein N-acetyltransferase